MRRPQTCYSASYMLAYGARLVVVFLLLELGLHWGPCFAIATSGSFVDMTPSQLGFLTFVTLLLMWLKFTFIWRFARWWALLDGVEVTENMVRCMHNNYSLVGFWKGWHRSFNRWLVRYIYVPLGGDRYRWLNVWVVFGFVAVWHDFEPKLLVWGAMNAIFMSIESGVVIWAHSPALKSLRSGPFWPRICGASGSVWIVLLMTINLTGYGVGLDGTVFILNKLMRPSGLQFLGTTFVIMYSCTRLMLAIRERKEQKTTRGSQEEVRDEGTVLKHAF
eukprot:FR734554.1.p1 GENE.FR734554.1~~FR734554.1.p1  ORF type:complete len:294 (+),score=27.45 FR734554.1:56-883(+)